ncbi:MAG: glycerophosphoryl diester phosphodiesterase [Chloroflexota bacterium]|nr:glycerophosphoryl diester phosphodiesterase [Chloroflexota bacterium]
MLLGGHRGNPHEHPENTLASFASAIGLGVDVIECDVHLTRDGRLAVIHDHTLDRTTNGSGAVGARTMAELRALDAGKGEPVPELPEVLELARGRVGLAIEIKSPPVRYPGLEEEIVRTLRDQAMVDECAVICFDHRVIRKVRDLEEGLVVGALVAGRPLLLPELLAYARAEVYSPHWSFVDDEVVAETHDCGAVVGVWTVDDPATLDTVVAAGVDAVYSNRPGVIAAALAERGVRRPAT